METLEEKIKNYAKDFKKVLIIANFDLTMEYPLSISKALYNLSPSVEIFYTAFPGIGLYSNEYLRTIDDKEPKYIKAVKNQMIKEKEKLPDETRFPKIVRHEYDIGEHAYNSDPNIYDAIILYWNPINHGLYSYFIDIAKKLLTEDGFILVWFPPGKPDSSKSFDSDVFENIVDYDNLRIVSGFKTLIPEKYINLLDDKHLDGPFIYGDLSSIVKGISEAPEEEYRFYREIDGEKLPITEIDVSNSEGVFQREFAITNKNKEKTIIGTYGAGPCVIVCMRNRETTDTFLGHIDTANGVDSFEHNMDQFPRNDTDVYIVGGDESSKYLVKRILQVFNKKLYNIKFLYILWPRWFKIGNEIYDTKGSNFGINCITGETYCFVDIDPKYDKVVEYYPITNQTLRKSRVEFKINYTGEERLIPVNIPDAKKDGSGKKKTRKRRIKHAARTTIGRKRSSRKDYKN
jgi:hypothetical protein